MNLSENYKTRESWKKSLPMYPVYKSKMTGEIDIDLRNICRNEKQLTLNDNSLSGFNEIDLLYFWEYADYQKPDLDLSKYSLQDICKKLIDVLTDYFVRTWDSKKFHLILASGGCDTRIIARVLKRLTKQMDLGDLHFVCEEPEGSIFKDAMKAMGWNESQYSVHKDGQPLNGDYFSYGNFNDNTNAFWTPGRTSWDNIVKNPKDCVLVTGNYGGELIDYPARFVNGKDRYQQYYKDCVKWLRNMCRRYVMWGDVLMPYVSYDFINTALNIPDKYIKMGKTVSNQDQSIVRIEILKQLEDETRFFIGHVYDFTLPETRSDYIKERYYNSKFYCDFKHINYVHNAKPWIVTKPWWGSLDSKLYGLATMYEGI